MKSFYWLLFYLFIGIKLIAQTPYPINFENIQTDTFWTAFANGISDPDDISIILNSDKSGINVSENTLEFKIKQNASSWVGMYGDFEPIQITNNYHTISLMIYKTMISPCAIRIDLSSNGGAPYELKVANTLINEWELLTFDLSEAIGYSYNRLVISPDYRDSRNESTSVLIDNIKIDIFEHVDVDLGGSKTIYLWK